jgi:hypothetical protein
MRDRFTPIRNNSQACNRVSFFFLLFFLFTFLGRKTGRQTILILDFIYISWLNAIGSSVIHRQGLISVVSITEGPIYLIGNK